MLNGQEGLTETYNRFHDPDETAKEVQELRQLQVEMDNAVAAAYGWADLDLGHGFHQTKQGVHFAVGQRPAAKSSARLSKLNHERYAEEVAHGLHRQEKGGRHRVQEAESGKAKKRTAQRPGLFVAKDDNDS